jgi:hypothetical protein
MGLDQTRTLGNERTTTNECLNAKLIFSALIRHPYCFCLSLYKCPSFTSCFTLLLLFVTLLGRETMGKVSEDGGDETAAALCRRARSLWLSLASDTSLAEVEELYRQAWSLRSTDGDSNRDDGATKEAGDKLALLLLQSGRNREADEILQSLGYACRLAVFSSSSRASSSSPQCRMYDNYLTPTQLDILRSVFQSPDASYWTDHNYSVEPPSPYFSFVIPLNTSSTATASTPGEEFGFLGDLVHRLQNHVASSWKPAVQHATRCEVWAHNRPHCTGHQLHFDTDNEGCGGVMKHPMVSCILYLTEGGPSLVTNQRLTSRNLADRGWLCHAVPNRLVVMDGKVLHGVPPGNPKCGGSSSRRVTLMVAFWKDIRVREDGGAARTFPRQPAWAQTLLQPLEESSSSTTGGGTAVEPEALDCVYEQVGDGKPWTPVMGFPDYEQVFQGF